jgi:hypothetical protein
MYTADGGIRFTLKPSMSRWGGGGVEGEVVEEGLKVDAKVFPGCNLFVSAYLIALAARVVREVGALARRAARANRVLPVFALDTEIRFATPKDRAAFADELATAVSRLAAKYHDEAAPDGRWQRLMVAVHPLPGDAAA